MKSAPISRLGIPQLKLILDSGADGNFTFAGFWDNQTTGDIGDIHVTRLGTRKCTPIIVTPAFGVSNVIDNQIQLEITFNKQASISPWFYVLPQNRAGIFIGKPLLKELRFQLCETGETITIGETTINIPESPRITREKSSFLTVKLASPIDQIKDKFPTLFSNTFSMELKHGYRAHIELRDFPFKAPKARFSSGTSREAIREYVRQSLENGLIERIDTKDTVALSPVFPIRQSADKIRVVTDLREANKALQYTPRPIPTTQSILSNLSQKKIFSAIDIRKAYQQIPLEGASIGIITEFGNYRFTRMPYRLASAPYWWGEFLQNILAELPPHARTIVQYYYDDIVIASEDAASHAKVLDDIFELLVKYGLSISEEKLQLQQDFVNFLGYEIRYNRVTIEKSKIEAIRRWELPRTKEAIRSFVGFVNFLRPFIPDTSKLIAPFYDVIKQSETRKREPISAE